MASNSSKITSIEELQNEGAKTVSVDGVSITRDFGELRKRKQELIASDDTIGNQRPRISAINLGSSF